MNSNKIRKLNIFYIIVIFLLNKVTLTNENLLFYISFFLIA